MHLDHPPYSRLGYPITRSVVTVYTPHFYYLQSLRNRILESLDLYVYIYMYTHDIISFLQCAKLVARVKFVFPRVINYKRRGREGSGLTIKSCKLVQTHAAGPCTDHFASPLRSILNLLTYPLLLAHSHPLAYLFLILSLFPRRSILALHYLFMFFPRCIWCNSLERCKRPGMQTFG